MNRRFSDVFFGRPAPSRSASSPAPEASRRAIQPKAVAPAPAPAPLTTLDEGLAYLMEDGRDSRSVYITDNPFLSRVPPPLRHRFFDALVELAHLETLSLQRSFITDDCIKLLCERWTARTLPHLSKLNLNQNLISDVGFLALRNCLLALPTPNLQIWALRQLRPSAPPTHLALVDTIERNPNIILFEFNWRSDQVAARAKALLDHRQRHYVSHGQNLTAALVELQARTPHLKVFRLADNAALACSWTDAGVEDQAQLLPGQYGDEQAGGAGVPSLAQVSAGLSLLITNQHLHTLELPGNGLMTSFVEFLFGAIVDDGALRSLRHLNLERNHFGISDVAAIVSLLDVHSAFAEEANPHALLPLESLRLAGQQGLAGTEEIELNRDSILAKFIWNHSLTDLTLDVGADVMSELRLYLGRNAKKRRSRIAISSNAAPNPTVLTGGRSPAASATLRRQATALKAAAADEKGLPSSPPKARFLFSPKSPVEQDEAFAADTIDDVMSMVARESPIIEDFSLSSSGFLCCLHEQNERRFSRALVNLLAYNIHLHTVALTNCGIRDPFLEALIAAKANGDFPNLVVLDFTRNSLSDDIIVELLQCNLFSLEVLRLRHRSTVCSPQAGARILSCLRKYHNGRIKVLEFDFDNTEMQKSAERLIADFARESL